jgi:hypothetical protein
MIAEREKSRTKAAHHRVMSCWTGAGLGEPQCKLAIRTEMTINEALKR